MKRILRVVDTEIYFWPEKMLLPKKRKLTLWVPPTV